MKLCFHNFPPSFPLSLPPSLSLILFRASEHPHHHHHHPFPAVLTSSNLTPDKGPELEIFFTFSLKHKQTEE